MRYRQEEEPLELNGKLEKPYVPRQDVSGSFRAHEQWDLPEPPDIVTFAKKMMVAGYYTTLDKRPKEVG